MVPSWLGHVVVERGCRSGTTIADRNYCTFSHANPVLARIQAGDTVRTKAVDAGCKDCEDVQRSEPSRATR
jgi:hypothetical protein